MSALSENVLYWLARSLYSSQVAHSSEMKEAVADPSKQVAYRALQLDRILRAARRYGITFEGRDVVDLGCNDGALTHQFPAQGAASVIGVDINREGIARARQLHAHPKVEYRESEVAEIPVASSAADLVICFDVFEHVAQPAQILRECDRILRPGGEMLVGTWGWGHPFAPHLWQTMPVPWAHVLLSERTVVRTCRRVHQSAWYVPNIHDFDANGERRKDKFLQDTMSTQYLNKYWVRDFERVFTESAFDYRLHLEPFGSRWARWSKVFLGWPALREYIHSFLWVVLTKTTEQAREEPLDAGRLDVAPGLRSVAAARGLEAS